jgi:hypothetical protein
MRIQIRVFAALLVLGGIFPAWGSPHAGRVPPAGALETLSTHDRGQKAVAPAVPSRGQLLYENHCMACHESVVHIRTRKRVESLSALRIEVLRWSAQLQLHWGREEVEEVVSHLNRQYYKFESR